MNRDEPGGMKYGGHHVLFTVLIVLSTLMGSAGGWIISSQTLGLETWIVLASSGLGGLLAGLAVSLLVSELINKPWQDLLSELNNAAAETGVVDENSNDPIMVIKQLRQAISRGDASAQPSQKKDELDQLFDLMPVGVITLDYRLNITRANQQALTMLGRHRPQIQNQNFSKLINFDSANTPDIEEWLENCLANKIKADSHWSQVEYSTLEREKRYFEIFIHYSKGSAHEFVITLVDHTEQQLSEDRKVDFIAIAAHELRAPITVIRGYIQVFEDELVEKLSDEQKEFMKKMNVSAAQLAGFINNILSVARIERDHIPVNLEKDDWRSIIIDACTDLSIRAEAHNRQMKLILPKELPPVAVDRASIVHVVNNLIDNAIKYTHDGDTIIVRVGMSPEGMVQTEIEDHGIGIPVSLMGSLFTKFYRSHRSKKQFGGTGLGLFLSKTIVESHYGSIWAQSKEGEGSTFAFALPTYDSVAEKIAKANNGMAEGITRKEHGWIKNHSLYRG